MKLNGSRHETRGNKLNYFRLYYNWFLLYSYCIAKSVIELDIFCLSSHCRKTAVICQYNYSIIIIKINHIFFNGKNGAIICWSCSFRKERETQLKMKWL